MCQLLGMNCNVPTDICFSFEGFCERGGTTDEHKDGWGIAFFEDNGCRSFLDPNPSVESSVSTLIRNYPIKSRNVISHIRKATYGEVKLENTHPFTRELWGRYWVFAHNGDLHDFQPDFSGAYEPVGGTDSERAFCLILERLKRDFRKMPPSELLGASLQQIAEDIAKFGIFNFMLSNGECLFVFCTTKLSYIVRQHPFSTASLKDKDVTIDFREHAAPGDRVAVIATEPLTVDETWIDVPQKKLLIFQDGELMV
ncbi:MAG: class II glutamine amidotransferase [Candidatus Polarisedimenticolaceae bacterium]|nr:class II glutamine amidotransferase [Candidatus Polarisedimenticolaceae bacterium]